MKKDCANFSVEPTCYYRLNPACERGKTFLKVVSDGMKAVQAAEKVVEECDAIDWMSGLYADFGGISAFVFPTNTVPDGDVFEDTGSKDREGRTLWAPRVHIEERVCLRSQLDLLDDDTCIKHSKTFKGSELVGVYGRKAVAKAVGMELHYLHPVEELNLLKIPKDEIHQYVRGEKSLDEVLQDKLLVSKRDKALKQFAFKGEEEHNAFLQAIDGKEFGLYMSVQGSPQAVDLFKEVNALPVVPQGTLNRIVGVRDGERCVGFFIHSNWIWVQSRMRSDLEASDDWQSVSPEVWNVAVKEAQEQYSR